MGVPEWIQAVKETCTRGLALRGLGGDVWTRSLSPEEETILMAAASGAQISLTENDNGIYPVVLADGKPIFERRDTYSMALQWEGLGSLCRRGVVERGESAERFTLSEIARDKGRRLKANRLFERQSAMDDRGL